MSETRTSKYQGHTPEPWHQCEGNEHIISDSTHMKVAQTSPIVVNNYNTGKTEYTNRHKSQHANGLLIADAPQILRERDEARELLLKCTGIIDLFVAANPEVHDLLRFRDEICKAIGFDQPTDTEAPK